jgi:molybdate transport system substrate-binding protein
MQDTSMKHFWHLLFSTLAWLATASRAGEVSVAVAANFANPMREIAQAFEKTSGHTLKMSLGTSGKFYAQIQNGAPFEVFFSADQDKPTALENDGLVVPGMRFTYAVGSLVLWSAKSGLLDKGPEVLKRGQFNKLALANPKLAPYGAAAVEVLQHLELEQKTQSKWVLGENIAQTYQFVSTGNADLGFVALAQLMEKGRIQEGSVWLVPGELHSPILQDAVLLRKGETNMGARELLQFMQGPVAVKIIQSYGYKTIPK